VQTIVIDDPDVSQSVSHAALLCRHPNNSEILHGGGLLRPKEHCYIGVQSPCGKGKWGRFCPLYNIRMADQIMILLALQTLGDPRHNALDGGPNPLWLGEEDSMQPSPNYFGHLLSSVS